MKRKPFNFARDAAFIVIIRAVHSRGPEQDAAFAELRARGLWLSDDQEEQAGRRLNPHLTPSWPHGLA